MTPEEQRIAIAEACSLQEWDIYHDGLSTRLNKDLPDYLNDLNAMHEVEMLLDNPSHNFGCEKGSLLMYDCYAENLSRLFGRSIRATAAQRAEAFLRAIGKWK